ncbi:MFS transporter [Georgenia faecalis]|uniref:MFS transporter n=1 Tax=Georgenia faecalis TaxID=2483799 RepID=UPI000FD77373|nr:MFS transporter [Georgenia faecalis]
MEAGEQGAGRRPIAVLIASNLFGGVGVASGVAVGALLVEEHGGTAIAGLGQAVSVLGAAVAAIPLATMAARHGRRWSLATGYAIALTGAVLIITAALLGQILVLLLGLGLFGVAQAVNLQSRYAAAEGVPAASRAKAMSIVIWATTIGSVAGPNLSAVGERLGTSVGVPGLAGPYLFSLVSFAGAGLAVALFYRPARTAPMGGKGGSPAPGAATGAGPVGEAIAAPTTGAVQALRWALARRVPRFAVVLLAGGHAVMVMVMVMTPLHMQHNGMSLQVVGVVISLHVLGMFAFSPVFGWLVDRYGAIRTATLGVTILLIAIVVGFVAASTHAHGSLTAVALTVLGLGWSATTISASALITSASTDAVRVPLQGATDAGMNYAGAAAAALAGPVLAVGGFHAVNIAGALILAPVLVLLVDLVRRPEASSEPAAATPPAAATAGASSSG